MRTILADDVTATAFTGALLRVQVEIPFTRSAIGLSADDTLLHNMVQNWQTRNNKERIMIHAELSLLDSLSGHHHFKCPQCRNSNRANVSWPAYLRTTNCQLMADKPNEILCEPNHDDTDQFVSCLPQAVGPISTQAQLCSTDY